jgi:hypothetical protein
MSDHGYDEDFEEYSDDGFEVWKAATQQLSSRTALPLLLLDASSSPSLCCFCCYRSWQSDNELEAPQQHVEQEEQALVQQQPASIAGVSADAWPSLTAGQPAWRASQKRSNTAAFSRSLFGGKLS